MLRSIPLIAILNVEQALIHKALDRSAQVCHRYLLPVGAIGNRAITTSSIMCLETVDSAMHRTGTALGDAAAEFGAGHAEHIAQHPKQRHVRRCVEASILTIGFFDS